MTPETLNVVRLFEERGDIQLRHEQHVHVAWYYARTLPFWEGLTKMRSGLRAWLESRSVSALYHETKTVAYFCAVYEARFEGETFEEFKQKRPDLLGKDSLLRYYTKERLESAAARASFVLPLLP